MTKNEGGFFLEGGGGSWGAVLLKALIIWIFPKIITNFCDFLRKQMYEQFFCQNSIQVGLRKA